MKPYMYNSEIQIQLLFTRYNLSVCMLMFKQWALWRQMRKLCIVRIQLTRANKCEACVQNTATPLW